MKNKKKNLESLEQSLQEQLDAALQEKAAIEAEIEAKHIKYRVLAGEMHEAVRKNNRLANYVLQMEAILHDAEGSR